MIKGFCPKWLGDESETEMVVAHPEIAEHPAGRLAAVLAEHGARLLAVAVATMAVGIFLVPPPFGMAAVAAGGTLAFLAGAGQWLVLRGQIRRKAAVRDIGALAADDPTPSLLTAADGEIRFMNEAARKRFRSASGTTLARLLSDLFANPAGVLFRLQEKAGALGGAREDVVTRRGHVRLTTIAIPGEGFLWRFDEVLEGRSSTRGAEALNLPMLTASATGAILFMNDALRRVIGERVKHLDRVFPELPVRPGAIQEIMSAEGPVLTRVAEITGPGGRRELYFLPAEPAADAGERPVALIYEDLPVALVRLSPGGQIEFANRLARELFHAAAGEDLAGGFLGDRLEGLGRSVRDWLGDASHGRGLGRPEVLRVRGREAECYVQVTLSQSAEGAGQRLVAVMSDATELKTLEAQFVQSQKMQAIGQLAGGVAHDFNNLLTAISGHCDLMLLRHDQGDPDYADLVQIHQNANRAAALVGQLLAFSRKQTMQPQVLDLRDTLSDLTHLLNRLVGERVTLNLHHEAGLPPIRADRRQLEQVIMNLVVNARDAMPDGGDIRIESQSIVLASDLERDRARVPAGRYVTVKVEDHGIGIPSEKLSQIFEPFYTTKRTGEGTGLGLSTAYGIIKQSGGYIFVDSVVGIGTSFTLYFPAHEGDGAFEAAADQPYGARTFRSRHQREAGGDGRMGPDGVLADALRATSPGRAGPRQAEPAAPTPVGDAERRARRAIFGIGPVLSPEAAGNDRANLEQGTVSNGAPAGPFGEPATKLEQVQGAPSHEGDAPQAMGLEFSAEREAASSGAPLRLMPEERIDDTPKSAAVDATSGERVAGAGPADPSLDAISKAVSETVVGEGFSPAAQAPAVRAVGDLDDIEARLARMQTGLKVEGAVETELAGAGLANDRLRSTEPEVRSPGDVPGIAELSPDDRPPGGVGAEPVAEASMIGERPMIHEVDVADRGDDPSAIDAILRLVRVNDASGSAAAVDADNGTGVSIPPNSAPAEAVDEGSQGVSPAEVAGCMAAEASLTATSDEDHTADPVYETGDDMQKRVAAGSLEAAPGYGDLEAGTTATPPEPGEAGLAAPAGMTGGGADSGPYKAQTALSEIARPGGSGAPDGPYGSGDATMAPVSTDPSQSGEAVILLVEDEAPVRAFASRALRMRGYTVIEAENAEQALATLADPGLKVDVFVTDVIMPGMDGPSWVRRALETRPGVRVVFVSGYAEDSFGDEQSRIPNSVFLPKPFSLSELTETVHEQMH